MESLPHYMLWLIAAVACFLLEAVGISGLGFLFAGLGALTAGSLVTAMPELTPLQQGIIFCASTALWALILWKPLQKQRHKSAKNGYKNMVGDTVYVGADGLEPDKIGEVTWSGTIMKARLAHGQEALAAGATAIIKDVAGNTLIIKSN